MLLWNELRGSKTGHKIKRQVKYGRFTLDFYCSILKVVIEIDGSNHYLRGEHDLARDKELESFGIVTIRFPASEVLKSPASVAERIRVYLDSKVV